MTIQTEVRVWLTVIVIGFAFLFYLHAQPSQPGQSSYIPSEFDSRLISFNRVWTKFYREHFSCPDRALYLSDCHPEHTTVLDYGQFSKTVKEWQKQLGEYGRKEEGK